MYTGPSDVDIDSLLDSILSDVELALAVDVEVDVDVDVDDEADDDGLLKADTFSGVCGSDVPVSSSSPIFVASSGGFVDNGSLAIFNRVDNITGLSSGRSMNYSKKIP